MEMSFKQFLIHMNEQFVIESFDTSYEITKIIKGNPDFYLINIDDKEYRIFIEKSEDDIKSLHIGFEYNHPSKGWTTEGLYGNLSAKEILGLFGSILKVLKTYRFNNIMFCTNEQKKFRTYIRMMTKLCKEFNFESTSHNDQCIFGFNGNNKPDVKFKYKK